MIFTTPDGEVQVTSVTVLDETELGCWLTALNDLRLVLGTRLDVSEDDVLLADGATDLLQHLVGIIELLPVKQKSRDAVGLGSLEGIGVRVVGEQGGHTNSGVVFEVLQQALGIAPRTRGEYDYIFLVWSFQKDALVMKPQI